MQGIVTPLQRIVTRSHQDIAYRQLVLKDASAAMQAAGILPEDLRVRVL